MLSEQRIPVAEPGASEAGKFQIVLSAFAAGGLDVGEFSAVLYTAVPAWDRQDEAERSLVLLLDDWEHETTTAGGAEIAAAMRRAALGASGADAG